MRIWMELSVVFYIVLSDVLTAKKIITIKSNALNMSN
jgi:hypothetical protein